MATHKSAIKRNRQNEVKRLRNRSMKSQLKTRIKRVIAAIGLKNYEEARETLDQAIPIIDKTAAKGIMHKRNAARKISRLTRKVNALKA